MTDDEAAALMAAIAALLAEEDERQHEPEAGPIVYRSAWRRAAIREAVDVP